MNRVHFDDQVVIQMYNPEEPPNAVQNADTATAGQVITPINIPRESYCDSPFRRIIDRIKEFMNTWCMGFNQCMLRCIQIITIRERNMGLFAMFIFVVFYGSLLSFAIYYMFSNGNQGNTPPSLHTNTTALPIIENFRGG
jgi:hypothetical protein